MAPPRRRSVVITGPRFDPRRNAPTGPRTNERIRVPEVRVVGADGEMLGVMDTREALRLARERSLDLVEVNPKAVPPVCKIMDFGKFKYDEAKKTREAKKKQTIVKLKEIKLRPKTDDHDIEFKVKHIRDFLDDGDKVKITVRFRGREITHPEMAQRQIDNIIERVKDVAVVESASRMEGRAMMVILAPRPSGGKGGGARATGAPSSAVAQSPASVRRPAPTPPPTDVDESDDDEADDLDDGNRAAAAATATKKR